MAAELRRTAERKEALSRADSAVRRCDALADEFPGLEEGSLARDVGRIV